MQFLDTGWAAPAVAIADFIRDHGAEIPAVTYDALAAYYPSPVDRVVTCCEALYAVADELPEAGHVLAAQLARFAQDGGFQHLGQSDRAPKMIAGLRRRLGELAESTAPPSQDPAPLDQFVPAPPAED